MPDLYFQKKLFSEIFEMQLIPTFMHDIGKNVIFNIFLYNLKESKNQKHIKTPLYFHAHVQQGTCKVSRASNI